MFSYMLHIWECNKILLILLKVIILVKSRSKTNDYRIIIFFNIRKPCFLHNSTSTAQRTSWLFISFDFFLISVFYEDTNDPHRLLPSSEITELWQRLDSSWRVLKLTVNLPVLLFFKLGFAICLMNWIFVAVFHMI